MVAVLLSTDASVDAPDSFGRTPLHWAARGGHSETVRALISAGAPLDADAGAGIGTILTPLIWAARGGHSETVRALLEAGARVDVTDAAGQTPLHLAARGGHSEIVTALLEFHALEDAVTSAYAGVSSNTPIIPGTADTATDADSASVTSSKAVFREALRAHLTEVYIASVATPGPSEQKKLDIFISQFCDSEDPLELIHNLAAYGRFAITSPMLPLSDAPRNSDGASFSSTLNTGPDTGAGDNTTVASASGEGTSGPRSDAEIAAIARAQTTINTEYLMTTLTFLFGGASPNPAARKADGLKPTYGYSHRAANGTEYSSDIRIPALMHANSVAKALVNHPILQRYMECLLYREYLRVTLQAGGFDFPVELFNKVIGDMCRQSAGFLEGSPGEFAYAAQLIGGVQFFAPAPIGVFEFSTPKDLLLELKEAHSDLKVEIEAIENNGDASSSAGAREQSCELGSKQGEAATLKAQARALLTIFFSPAREAGVDAGESAEAAPADSSASDAVAGSSSGQDEATESGVPEYKGP